MKYIINQIFNKNHMLSQRLIGIADSLDECNKKAKLRGFDGFTKDKKHADAYRTNTMLYSEKDKVVGATQLIAMEYDDTAAEILNGDI